MARYLQGITTALVLFGTLVVADTDAPVVGQPTNDVERERIVDRTAAIIENLVANNVVEPTTLNPVTTSNPGRRLQVTQAETTFVQAVCDIFDSLRRPLGHEYPQFTVAQMAANGLPYLQRCSKVCDDYCAEEPNCRGYMTNVCRQACCGDGVAALCTEDRCLMTYNTPAPRRCYGFCVPGFNGDPHFRPLSGSVPSFEFMGAAGLSFAVVTEPTSVLNAEFSNLGMGDVTFVKAIGYVDTSGNALTVNSDTDDCTATTDNTERRRSPLVIHLNGELVDVSTQLYAATNATDMVTALLVSDSLEVNYVRNSANGHGVGAFDESVELKSATLSYTITRPAGACHLNMGVYILDSDMLANPTPMHGLLGQTAAWGSLPIEQQKLIGDESDYMVASLLDTTSFQHSTYNQGLPSSSRRKLLVHEGPTKKSAKGGLVHEVGCGRVPPIRSF